MAFRQDREAALTASAQGRLFVVSGPSGVGKDAVLERLFTRVSKVTRSVSATTRPTRPGETEGVDYYFLTRAEFEEGIVQQVFLEHAAYGDNLYGTPRDKVVQQCAQGIDVILKIDVQGALCIKQMVPQAVLVFIQPPSEAELERRLRMRGTDSEDRILQRLAIALKELECIDRYDYLITNADLEEATDHLCAIIVAERCRIPKTLG